MGCYIWYSKEGTKRGRSPPRPLVAVPNVTAHPSTASVPITVMRYNGPLLCGFNVPIKGLILSEGKYFLQNSSFRGNKERPVETDTAVYRDHLCRRSSRRGIVRCGSVVRVKPACSVYTETLTADSTRSFASTIYNTRTRRSFISSLSFVYLNIGHTWRYSSQKNYPPDKIW